MEMASVVASVNVTIESIQAQLAAMKQRSESMRAACKDAYGRVSVWADEQLKLDMQHASLTAHAAAALDGKCLAPRNELPTILYPKGHGAPRFKC